MKLRLAVVLTMVLLSSISPWLREAFHSYIYAGGVIVALLSAFVLMREGKAFEKIWGWGMLFLSLHQALNLLPALPFLPYIGDVFYLGFYIMLFMGNLTRLWETNSGYFFASVIVLAVVSAIVSTVASFLIPIFSRNPLASFFNLFYIMFAGVNVLATVPFSLYDRAWMLRTLAFGIILITEVWFTLWAYFGYNPPDPSVMWFGVVMLAVLAKRSGEGRTRIMRL